ncbi:ladderlectin-like protein, partial [Dinothrombium tinctorium]
MILIFILMFTHVAYGNANCPPNWIKSDDKCLIAFTTDSSVYDNYKLCKSLNATMVSIHSEKEYNNVGHLINEGYWFWLGGVQIADRIPSFAWTDGTKFNYSKWSHGEPQGEKFSLCMAIIMETRKGWVIYNCGRSHYQLCQKSVNKDIFYDNEYPEHYVRGLAKNQAVFEHEIKSLNFKIKN